MLRVNRLKGAVSLLLLRPQERRTLKAIGCQKKKKSRWSTASLVPIYRAVETTLHILIGVRRGLGQHTKFFFIFEGRGWVILRAMRLCYGECKTLLLKDLQC